MRPLSAALVPLAIVALLASACSPDEQDIAETPAQNASAPVSQRHAPPAEKAETVVDLNQFVHQLDADCRKRLVRIRFLTRGIPRIFLDLKRKADEIDRDIIECTSLCREYLNSCTGTPLDAEVQGTYARMLFGRYDRIRHGLRQDKVAKPEMESRLTQYRAEVRSLANAAAGAQALPPLLRADALRLLVELSERERDFEGLRRYASDLERQYPDFDLISNTIYAHGRSFIAEGRYSDALQYIRNVLETRGDDDALAIYNIVAFQAMTGVGDLEGIEDLMETILIEYPERAPQAKKPYIRKQYDQWFNVAEFWIGFCRFAQGDIPGAREAFENHKARVLSLAARLAEEQKSLDPVVKIFYEMRTLDLLKFFDDFYGQVPEVDLDFGESWVTTETLSLAESHGDVVLIMFRRPGDRRSQAFFEEAGRLLEEYRDQGLRAATVAYLIGRPNEEREAQKRRDVLEELDELEIEMPAGFDPDRKRQSFFRALHGTVGPSASCVLIDRRNEIAWFKADPRDMDKRILRRVVQRLLEDR